MAHRIVAEMWHDNPLKKKEVNHKDMDRLNNHWSNLEWCTHRENMQHGAFVRNQLKELGLPSPRKYPAHTMKYKQ